MGGKAGDILSITPCLYQEFIETGKRPTLVTSKEYSSIPKALEWLNVLEYDGNWEMLGNLIRFAKRFGKVDFIPQQHAVGYPLPARKHPSFQYEQYERMGRLHQWGKLPLVLPRTGNVEIPNQPYIVYADHSQSSPFKHREDLFSLLSTNFPGHLILRLSSIRASHLLDFLALFDASDLIVTIDTSFLHLSAATHKPVLCLITDEPSPWHGSAYHPRMSFHCRYKDYEHRKQELLCIAKRVIS